MIQHLDRHKVQLFYYLKLQGKPVNTADLWGQNSTGSNPATRPAVSSGR